MVELGERACLSGEALGESAISGIMRQDLKGNQPIEILLASLVNRAHAPLTEQFQDFQLRKMRRELGDAWRREAGIVRGWRATVAQPATSGVVSLKKSLDAL